MYSSFYAFILLSHLTFLGVSSLKFFSNLSFRTSPRHWKSNLLYILHDNDFQPEPSTDGLQSDNHIRKIPDLASIRKMSMQSERSDSSKRYCIRSGGYPNDSVKENVYLFLWACAAQNIRKDI